MKVLKINKTFLEFCGISTTNERPKPIENALKALKQWLLTVGHINLGYFAAKYIHNNASDISGVSVALIMLAGSISVFGSYLGFINNEPNLKLLHYELQNLVDSGK